MKNLIFTLVTLLFLPTRSFCGKSDSLYTIELKCKLTIPENDRKKMYDVVLLYDNKVIESVIFVDENSFLLRLKDNTQYTLRILKEDFVPMVITLDTRVKDNNNCYQFDSDFFLHLYGFTLSLSLDKPTQAVASN